LALLESYPTYFRSQFELLISQYTTIVGISERRRKVLEFAKNIRSQNGIEFNLGLIAQSPISRDNMTHMLSKYMNAIYYPFDQNQWNKYRNDRSTTNSNESKKNMKDYSSVSFAAHHIREKYLRKS
jgi:hypothetical protein